MLSVDRNGSFRSGMITINYFTKQKGKNKIDILNKGEIILNNRSRIGIKYKTEDGKHINKTTERIFSDILPTNNITAPYSLDELYGTSEERKVGDIWKVNRDKMTEMHSAIGEAEAFPKKNIRGKVKIEAIENVNGVDCLRITRNVVKKEDDFNPIIQGISKKNIATKIFEKSTVWCPLDKKLVLLKKKIKTVFETIALTPEKTLDSRTTFWDLQTNEIELQIKYIE